MILQQKSCEILTKCLAKKWEPPFKLIIVYNRADLHVYREGLCV